MMKVTGLLFDEAFFEKSVGLTDDWPNLRLL